MADVHPSAVIVGDVTLASSVHVGPFCHLDGSLGPVTVGANTRLLHRASIQGPCSIGEGNTLFPGTVLGMAPQDVKFNPNTPGSGLIIGNENVFRESVTIHRGKTPLPTRLGHRNYFMAGSHAGHDCVIGDQNILSNCCMLAGHVEMASGVIMGGGAMVHQFCHIGRNAFIGGLTGVSMDLPPFFMTTGTNIAGSLNVVGMRRSGMAPDQIAVVRWVYQTLARSSLPMPARVNELRSRAGEPLVDEFLAFVTASNRGIMPGFGKKVRGTAAHIS